MSSGRSEQYRIGTRGGRLTDKLRDLFFGAFYYGLHQQIMHTISKYRDIVHVLILGEFLGLPVLGNYYTLRLLPYLVQDMVQLKARLARDVDVLELMHEGAAVH